VNDDYFVAIRLLMNSGLYVSGMKLLLSAIDSIAYLEYGDRGSPFVPWLETYADLTPVQVTAEELWELRNGLLHMSSYNSRKVTKGAVRKISYGTGIKPGYHEEAEVFLFDFMDLVHAFAAALQRWIPTVQADPDKLRAFVDRYDQVLSDTRIARRPAPDSP
jgi:hypothetical protein